MAPTSKQRKAPQMAIHRDGTEFGCYAWSPFVTKLEARLRFAGIDSYTSDKANLSEAPKGKVPYLKLWSSEEPAVPPRLLGDSTFIIRELVDEGVVDDLNSQLEPATKTTDLALRALLEDKLYFHQSFEKWHDNYYPMRDHALAPIPYPIRIFVGLLVYRTAMSTLHGQGSGRFSTEERQMLQREGWGSLETLLLASKRQAGSEQGPFWILGGENPTEADASLYGFIVAAQVCNAAPVTQKIVKDLPATMEYAERIHRKYFPDYAIWE